MNKHTQGSWVLDTRQFPETTEISNRDHIIMSADYQTNICKMPNAEYDEHEPERLSNARLIASAPELLEALEAIYNTHKTTINCPEWCKTEDEYFKEFPLYKKAQEAIAKARGE